MAFLQYDLISQEYPWTLSDIRKMPVSERTYWCDVIIAKREAMRKKKDG